MNIIVCVKQVPDTTEVRIDPETNTLMRKGVPSIMNPFDKNALEAAVQLKEEHGGTVTAITMGPPQAKAVLKECLSVGADKAYLVSDIAFGGADTLATSYTLASAIKTMCDYDLIICGKQAIDGDTAQVGPEIAEHLDIAQVTYVTKVKVEGDKIITEREHDEGYEVIEAQIPSVITVVKAINEPRYATVKSKMASNRVEIPTITSADLVVDEKMLGLDGSPTKVNKIFSPPKRLSGVMIKHDNGKDSACELIQKLTELRVI
ncbi:electron transfer flavoprotein beta subunit [Dethiosulfatibacter aminovorans DSM 17477]|uniref:Electron transfer flavoprotein small subunit n=1 Tax=Dethiosulfatibacter aminovorans DSM 17477 TaxID=1121476 RepID=A0A1M6MB66_9FIRM|nr:electron transfer flavoprotein subunit beta/FixA family protein [Dethiosulfatibacter aminovorans]SHJ80689.1 electron transfer flavoprotein beta subunit [Dethiosulfatibacter aminovorans DSM 17477]